MAELKQTYCSCYTAVRSSKKSSSPILDFITKLSANRLQHRQLTGEIKQWRHCDSMGALEDAKSLEHCGEKLFKTFDQPQRSSSSDLHLTSETLSVCELMLASQVCLLFTCPCTSVRAPCRLYFSRTQCKQDGNLYPAHSAPSLHLQLLLPSHHV